MINYRMASVVSLQGFCHCCVAVIQHSRGAASRAAKMLVIINFQINVMHQKGLCRT